ncbi:hypothetical protein Q5O14_01545 [Eubacteriaceae bacterium ES2]|nr:hypothetical protein Q5O14_01545 [Eubacteriaceae bacterium ES2]
MDKKIVTLVRKPSQISLKEWLVNYQFPLIIGLLLMIRFVLVLGLPIFAHAGAGHDDRLMIGFADSILNGDWLGQYSEMTLVKGAMFPLLLAFNRLVGIPYVLGMTALYAAACLFFIFVMKDLVASKKFLLLLLAFLLFNPVSFADETFFRVYRNSITAAQTLLIVGGMFGLYLNRKAKLSRMIFFALLTGISFTTFWLTREDGIWLLPFLVVAILITIISIVLENKKKQAEIVKRSLITVIPIVLMLLGTWTISAVNAHYYGVFTTNELNDDPFSKTIKMMYSIEDPVEADNVSVSREKMAMMIDVSPTLQSIEDDISESMDRWSWYDEDVAVREVEDGWFFWSFREAVADAGYYQNPQMAASFYEAVYDELSAAVDSGILSQRSTMPSALMSPWRTEYLQQYPIAILKTAYYIVNYKEVHSNVLMSIDDGQNGIRLFEKITGNVANYPSEDQETIDLLKASLLNKITLIYKLTGLILFLAAGIGYLRLSWFLLRKKHGEKRFEIWLLMTAIALSILVLILGVAYTDISAYVAISYWYLTGAYPLMIVFEGLGAYILFDWFRERRINIGNKRRGK